MRLLQCFIKIIFIYLSITIGNVHIYASSNTPANDGLNNHHNQEKVTDDDNDDNDDTLLTIAKAIIVLGITLIGVYTIYKITTPDSQPVNYINQPPTQPIHAQPVIINTSTYNRQYQGNPPPIPNPFTYNIGQHQATNVTGRTTIERIINDNSQNINVRSFLAHVTGIPFNAPNQIYINDVIRNDIAQIIHQNLYGSPEFAAIINVNHYFE